LQILAPRFNQNKRTIMGTGRTYNKAPVTRPKKSGLERRRRDKAQAKRLMALGVPEERIRKMDTRQIRQMLRHPKKVAAQAAG
jgi:hypothetical protein